MGPVKRTRYREIEIEKEIKEEKAQSSAGFEPITSLLLLQLLHRYFNGLVPQLALIIVTQVKLRPA